MNQEAYLAFYQDYWWNIAVVFAAFAVVSGIATVTHYCWYLRGRSETETNKHGFFATLSGILTIGPVVGVVLAMFCYWQARYYPEAYWTEQLLKQKVK